MFLLSLLGNRLLGGDVAAAFFDAIRHRARAAGLLSDEHFTVDGTQLDEAWASLKSFRPRKGSAGAPPDHSGNPTVNFRGERRRNDTHQSTTDPEARLYRKGLGREATLAYLGHVLLRGAAGLIRRHRPVIYTENDRADKSPELVRLIRSHGYRLFWHRPPLYSPDNFAGSTRNIFVRRILSFNMLCVHASANVDVRGAEEVTDDSAHPLASRATG